MSLFSIVQGVTPPTPPAPQPMPMTSPVPPMAPPAPPQTHMMPDGSQMAGPPMYNLPARYTGGPVNLDDGQTNFIPNHRIQDDGNWGQRPGYNNLPSYDGGGTIGDTLDGPVDGGGSDAVPDIYLIDAYRGIHGYDSTTMTDQQVLQRLQDPNARAQAQSAYNAT